MNEGKTIKRLLDEKGLTTQDLATAGGVTWQAAKKWIQTESMRPGARETATKALTNLKIDPELIWSATPVGPSKLDELKLLAKQFDKKHLQMLLTIMRSDALDQRRLIDYIEGRLGD